MLSSSTTLVLSTILILATGYPLDDDDNTIDTIDTDLPDLSAYGRSVFGKPSDESGRAVAAWDPQESPINPEELGNYLEGDILFPMDSRNGLVAQTSRWKDGVIPYEIAGQFSQKDLNTISDAMDQYHMHTCVRFKPKINTDRDYISIVSGNSGCWSSVGRIGGRQELNLQSPGCLSRVGTSIHELMHAVGFMHEQNRFERDDYVTILWKNIQRGRDNNFKKADEGTTSGYGVEYDYGSVMHYSDRAFSFTGDKTIVPRDSNSGKTMGQRNGFSKGDIEKIRKMYGCMDRDPVESNKDQNSSSNGGLLGLIFGK